MIDSFRGRYAFLSNFYSFNGEPSVEHIFQSMKCQSMGEQIWVLSSPSPGTAKRRGRKVSLRPDWEEIKLEIMEMCLREKFSDPVLKKMLLETEEEELIEGNNWGDTYWGVCQGKGENHLGRLLMKIRKEFSEEIS